MTYKCMACNAIVPAGHIHGCLDVGMNMPLAGTQWDQLILQVNTPPAPLGGPSPAVSTVGLPYGSPGPNAAASVALNRAVQIPTGTTQGGLQPPVVAQYNNPQSPVPNLSVGVTGGTMAYMPSQGLIQ